MGRNSRRKTVAHVGKGDPDAARKQSPKRYRRLRVVADPDPDGNFPLSRDVYLESAINPLNGEWSADMAQFSLPVDRVIDLIRWADRIDLNTVYEPPGNMAGHFRKKRDDQPTLFDIGEVK